MCFPVPKCDCFWSTTSTNSPEQFPLQETGAASQHPITTQPRSSHTVSIGISLGTNDDVVLQTLKDAANLFTQILDSPHTQQGARFCRDRCQPWCESHCPNWLALCFQCLCTCVINEEDGATPEDHPDRAFFKDLSSAHGPIVAGIGVQSSGIDISSLMITGKSLSENDKEHIQKCCIEAQAKIQAFFHQYLQKELFQTADIESSLPKTDGEEVSAIRQGFHSPSTHNPPTIWISPNHSPGEAPELMKQVNWTKLEQQLKGVLCRNARSGRNERVGGRAESVMRTIKNAFYYLLKGSPCFQPQIGRGNYSLTVSHPTFLQFLLCGLLTVNLIPVDEEGNPPKDTWWKLIDLISLLHRDPNQHTAPPAFPDPWDDSEVDGGLESDRGNDPDNSTGGATGEATVDPTSEAGNESGGIWFGPKEQQQLLNTAEKTNQLAQLFF
ncbi:hypothetical protein [Chlamydia gallinacea]|uniref:hypothetical protein n=1 Tax=Chlamydia gallinacea TaxID=1457153 RepID=UPI0024E26C92|nr:hypothetical protein [Chlamydia gallinacea]